MNPEDKRRAVELNALTENLIERKENRKLNESRKAATERARLIFFHQAHDLLIHLQLLIRRLFFVTLFNAIHFGLNLLHRFHRLVRVGVERKNDQTNDDRKGHDRPTPIADKCLQELQ